MPHPPCLAHLYSTVLCLFLQRRQDRLRGSQPGLGFLGALPANLSGLTETGKMGDLVMSEAVNPKP